MNTDAKALNETPTNHTQGLISRIAHHDQAGLTARTVMGQQQNKTHYCDLEHTHEKE